MTHLKSMMARDAHKDATRKTTRKVVANVFLFHLFNPMHHFPRIPWNRAECDTCVVSFRIPAQQRAALHASPHLCQSWLRWLDLRLGLCLIPCPCLYCMHHQCMFAQSIQFLFIQVKINKHAPCAIQLQQNWIRDKLCMYCKPAKRNPTTHNTYNAITFTQRCNEWHQWKNQTNATAAATTTTTTTTRQRTLWNKRSVWDIGIMEK